MLVAVIISGCSGNNQAKNYYISPDGNDANTGLSKKSAWASIEKVNSAIFQPGDAILFESGGEWKGQLQPKGNGEPGKPITIGSYGKGSMPIINIGKEAANGIWLVNQSWWEINGIEITSGAPPELGVKRQGIVATVQGEGKHMEHIVIRNCYIHDIWGQVGGSGLSVAILVSKLSRANCTANDILIENNRIERFDKVGIRIRGDSSIVVRGNYMENLGGDGIIVSGAYKGLIEYNIADRTCMRSGDPYLERGGEIWWASTAAIWLADCNQTVMQFNEVYNTGRQPANHDGEAYDFDFGCKDCILQYNYSMNNHGFLLIMERTLKNIARFNISQNDQDHLINLFCDTAEQNLIHNNVFYVDYGTVDIDYYYGDKGRGLNKDKGRFGASFRNNIFYATGQGRFRTVYTSRTDSLRNRDYLVKPIYKTDLFSEIFRKTVSYIQYNDSITLPPPVHGTKFFNNCYFGPWINGLPDDPLKITGDPMFVEPGSGGIGLSTLKGYMLKPGSPCINSGVIIETNSKRDFYGNPLVSGTFNIGAYNVTGK